jgi:hypothetical protein
VKLDGIPVVFGLILASGVIAAMLALAAAADPNSFPTITHACSSAGLPPGECYVAARHAGLLSLLAYALAFALAVWRGWLSPPAAPYVPMPSPSEGIDTGTALLLVAVLLVLTLHAGLLVWGPAYVSRIDESTAYALLISIENLALPLLMQLRVSAQTPTARHAASATLLLAVSLSPFRTMLVTAFGFAFLLPLAVEAAGHFRQPAPRPSARPILMRTAMVAGLAAVLLLSGYLDTTMRAPSLLFSPAQASLNARVRVADASDSIPHPMRRPQPSTLRMLIQRSVYPLYQAAIAARIASTESVPSLGAFLQRKFHLSDTPTFEEFVFRRIYGGHGRGETTSLPYGEAHAYVPAPPLLWMSMVPLILIVGWRETARRGLHSGVVFGIALWRSSFSGLLPILPALVLQVAALAGLARLRTPALRSGIVPRTATPALGVMLVAGFVVSAATVTTTMDRRGVLLTEIALDPACTLDSPTWAPIRLDRDAAARGWNLRSVVANRGVPNVTTIILPFGSRAVSLIPVAEKVIADLSTCRDAEGVTSAAPLQAVTVREINSAPRPINPLDAVTALAFAVALAALLRRREIA